LLYGGQDDWVHVNCALWSAEVKTVSKNDSLPEISKMKYGNRIPETTISSFADNNNNNNKKK
jgi:hypothetical protein